jgi:hypothetical protein
MSLLFTSSTKVALDKWIYIIKFIIVTSAGQPKLDSRQG